MKRFLVLVFLILNSWSVTIAAAPLSPYCEDAVLTSSLPLKDLARDPESIVTTWTALYIGQTDFARDFLRLLIERHALALGPTLIRVEGSASVGKTFLFETLIPSLKQTQFLYITRAHDITWQLGEQWAADLWGGPRKARENLLSRVISADNTDHWVIEREINNFEEQIIQTGAWGIVVFDDFFDFDHAISQLIINLRRKSSANILLALVGTFKGPSRYHVDFDIHLGSEPTIAVPRGL